MAVELCSEISGAVGMSPRISFSQDFSQADGVPIEKHNLLSNPSSSLDFDFCVRESFDRESSSADELFSDGKILPIQIKKKDEGKPKTQRPGAPRTSRVDDGGESAKESKGAINEADEKQNSKSFWRFKRSSSLNCGSGYGRSLCSLPLLSRSNSTGSEPPSVKKPPLHKDGYGYGYGYSHKHKSSSSSSSRHHQKPPLNKGYGSNHSHGGVRISPVLNVAPPTIFGFGSLFISKDKNKRK